MLACFGLAMVTGKRHKIKKEERICKLCDLNEGKDEFHFFRQYPNCKVLRKELIDNFISTEKINLTGNRLEKLNLLFAKKSRGSLNRLGRHLYEGDTKNKKKK